MLHEGPRVLVPGATPRRVCNKARNEADHFLQLSGSRADELRMVVNHARQDLLRDVEAANVGEGEAPPLPHGRMHGLQAGGVHGGSSSRLVLRPS